MKKLFFFFFFLIFGVNFYGQTVKKDSITRTANLVYSINGNLVSFNPETPPLSQVAGAPRAFYTYYCEFGDGNYSFQKAPKHTYSTKGNYQVQLSVTNNYDDGKPPATRPEEIVIEEESFDVSENEKQRLLNSYDGFRLQTNRDPVPEEEMQFILSYGNKKEYPTNGKIYLFYNEKKYKSKNFELIDSRLHHNERENYVELDAGKTRGSGAGKNSSDDIPEFIHEKLLGRDGMRQDLQPTFDAAVAGFQDYKVFDFDSLPSNEERNMFFTFKTTPDMLKDTSAVVTIRSIYVPERGNGAHKVLNKEMDIVTSHDPNKMSVYDTRLNYRLVRFKRLKYKVKFQNNGEGPARLIKLNVDVPEMLDKSSLEILDMYPECPICPDEEVRYSCLDTIISKDQISFQFKNIYLPGTEQKGVMEKDSTKGFVKYSMKFGKNFHKKKSKSKTEIIFDKNEPIVTNTSTSRFSPGISIGLKSGFNSFPKLDDSKSYFVGATISPYKSYKKYLQAEIMIGTHEFGDFSSVSEAVGPLDFPDGTIVDSAIRFDEVKSEFTKFNIDIVPISFRYNLNGIIGLGVGPQISFDVSNKVSGTVSSEYFSYFNDVVGDPLKRLNETQTLDNSKAPNDINYGVFGDFTLGASRIGPSLGLRYIYNFNEPNNQLHFYAIWKI